MTRGFALSILLLAGCDRAADDSLSPENQELRIVQLQHQVWVLKAEVAALHREDDHLWNAVAPPAESTKPAR